MDTETDSGSQSAPDKLESGGSEITVPTIDGSHAELNSYNSKAPSSHEAKIDNSIVTGVEPPPVNTETNEATEQADIQDTVKDATNLNKPIQPDYDAPGVGKLGGARRKANVDSESDESDELDDDDNRRAARLGRIYGPKIMFAAYQQSVEERDSHKKQSNNQEQNLVRGLMDYLRALEKRMGKLEANSGLNSTPRKEEKDTSSDPTDGDDTNTILDVRFFNSVYHITENGDYLGVHDGTKRGTYMCDRDPKYLIRVLYSRANEDVGQPDDNPVSEPPRANDIDILTFGVQSKPIATFFEKTLDITLDTGHLIRFEKPFRAVIRNIERVKEQLLKLETNFGRVTESVQQSQPNTPEAKANHEESDPLPFLPEQEDSAEAFDKPAALPHFQGFVAFVEKYLGKQIELFNRLKGAKEERVAFENLWMLFDSRDTIYCPLREVVQGETLSNIDGYDHSPIRRHTPQAYRVIATAGGTPWASSLTSANEAKVVNTSIAPTTVDLPGFPILSEVIAPLLPISRRVRNNYNQLYVYCFYIDFDGLTYGTVREAFIFKPYEGEVDIRSLQAYPIEYATNHTLLDRGKTFLQLTRVSHKQYDGLTTGSNREEINSPVIVDVKLAFEGDQEFEKQSIEVPKFNSPSSLWLGGLFGEAYDVMDKSSCSNPWCYDRSCSSNIYMSSQKKMRETIESETKLILEEYETLKKRGTAERKRFQYLMESKDMMRLLPGAVPGFALRNRRWVLLDINLVKDVEQESEWKNLFLPPGHQPMVQAMVETHTSDKEGTKGMDLVRGKGKGCIILLHGVPGVGKTSTAECVAAHTKKPLYPITCGDIGYNAEDVERNMETHFKLAHRWGCVLLLDEADVFLAKRDQKDVQRNGLVSVFLRILEYYSGILFLTTNRVGAIDDAFRSRLHLTLYYPKLTKDQTTEIFTHNFTRIADINSERKKKKLPPFEYTDTEDEILKWAKKNYKTLRWNGRQIRNAFQTVLALSEFHARGKKNKSKNRDKQANPVVKLRYFMVVANAATQFNEYLKATHGYDEERVAKRDFIRAVEFSPKSNPLLTETEDSSDQNSDEGDSSESDSEQSRNKEDQDHSSDSDSDHEKNKKKKSKSKSKEESSSKGATKKKSKKVKDDKVESERKSKDKKKEKKEKEDTDGSE